MIEKRVGHFTLPQAADPKWEITMVHGLGQDVVYSVYDDLRRKDVKIQDVTIGHDYIKLKFTPVGQGVSLKVVVIG